MVCEIATPFEQTSMPVPLGSDEVVHRYASNYVNYSKLEHCLHNNSESDRDSGSSSDLSLLSYLSPVSENKSTSSQQGQQREIERMEPQFITFLKSELHQLNRNVASTLQNLWNRVILIAQNLPQFEGASVVADCAQLISQGRFNCDEVSSELTDLFLFFNQNVKICADLLEVADHYSYGGSYFDVVVAISNVQFDPVLVAIAEIYQHLQRLTQLIEGKEHVEVGMDLDQIQRVTHKYWIHPKHAMHVKVAIAAHLPLVHIGQQPLIHFGPDAQTANPVRIYQAHGYKSSVQISSVYLDCPHLKSYHDRISKQADTSVQRIRWYGRRDPQSPVQPLYIERKTHRHDWTGAMSIKERAKIMQCNIVAFLRNQPQLVPEMLQRDASADILHEVQGVISERGQSAVLRSVFDRNAFQQQGDSSLRVTFDQNIRLFKERFEHSWCRNLEAEQGTGVGHDQSEMTNFEYCVMEVKLQTEAPEWLHKLVQKDIVVPASGFSKFLHGISLLYPDKIRETPSWIQPTQQRMYTISLDQMARSSGRQSREPVSAYKTNVSEHQFQPQSCFDKEVSQLDTLSLSGKGNKQNNSIEIELQTPNKQTPNPRSIRSYTQRNKITTIRTRVEPKVFFANERTFLAWLTVAILLVFAALSLINQQLIIIDIPDIEGGEQGMLRRCQRAGRSEIQCEAGVISGALMAPVGIIVIGYSLYMYRKRTFQILRRDTARYDEQLGPIVLSLVLICVMLLSYALSFVAAF
eukprot:TRINITY_DN2412_c0_g1_i1.p1 TRINITY_DN2412_c0_g1~~TRINITY_DN2412_c0_g1_i1.p1  ORF type:complete len:749 (-),score=39.47 TRINITY_DN2412_c0_g1_i1:2895-5141(-)